MTQRRFFRSIASVNGQFLAASMLALLPLAGCGDSDVEAKVSATNEIVAQTRAGTAAAEGITVENRETRATNLESLASKTSQIGGTNDQKAAVGILSAEMLMTAGSLLNAHLRDMEIQASQERALIGAAADAAATLEAIAEADAKLSLGSDREFLKRSRENAEAALKTLQSKIKELETPIGDLRKNVETRREKLVELQKKADDLRRQANDAGASAGFQYVEQSADVKMNAAQLRATIAGDELNLFELEPELNRANVALTGAQSVVSAADTATQALENFSSELTTNAKKLGEAAEKLRETTQTALDALNAQLEGPMTTTFEKATALFEAAARNAARGGAGREFSEAGAQAKLDAEANLATLGANRVASLNAQIALFEQLASAGSLFGGEAKQKSAIEALSTKRDEALTQTKERFTALLETLNGMDAEKTSVARMKASVESMLATLEGKGAAASGDSASGGQSAAAPAALIKLSTGAASPNAIIELFNAAKGSYSNEVAASRQVWAFRDKQRADFLGGMLTMAEGMVPLANALDSKFGNGSASRVFQSVNDGQGGFSGTSEYSLKDTPNGSVLTVKSEMGTAELPIVKEGNWYFVVADPIYDMLPEDTRAQLAPIVAQAAQLKVALPMMLQPIVDQINSGAIADADAVATMLKAAQRGPGGGR
jgi:prefoldin subunit 5